MAIVAIAVAAVASVASADGSKLYLATISPASVAAGSPHDYSLVLKNEASTQQLGSANVTAPAGFTITGATITLPPNPPAPPPTASLVNGVVQIRNLSLQPGQTSPTITITATAPCAATSGQWGLVAKQANDFNGTPGNNFTLDGASRTSVTVTGSCHLAFVAQPADALKGTAITTVALDAVISSPNPPSGPFVQVAVEGGSNQPVTSGTYTITLGAKTLGGTSVAVSNNTATTSLGVATFTGPSIAIPDDYRFVATSPGVTSATSNSDSVPPGHFTIWNNASQCSTQNCVLNLTTTTGVNSSVTGTSSTTGAIVGSPSADNLSCTSAFNYAPATTTVTTFSVTGVKTVVQTIDKAIVQKTPNNGAAFYEICYQGGAFTDRFGTQIPAGGTSVLPDCNKNGNVAPCVVSVTKDKAGDVVETFTLPAGDPKYR